MILVDLIIPKVTKGIKNTNKDPSKKGMKREITKGLVDYREGGTWQIASAESSVLSYGHSNSEAKRHFGSIPA